jgi:transcriptional regulator with XRE-family HTH domain
MLKSNYSKTYAQFLSWLKEGRVEKGLTIRQLAELLGEHSSVIGKIEVGERRLDIYEYCQYCNALGLDPKKGLDVLRQ